MQQHSFPVTQVDQMQQQFTPMTLNDQMPTQVMYGSDMDYTNFNDIQADSTMMYDANVFGMASYPVNTDSTPSSQASTTPCLITTCKNPNHIHQWVTEGYLQIERCEHKCLFCTGRKAEKYWGSAWFLRRHVRDFHAKNEYPGLIVSAGWAKRPQGNTRPVNKKQRAPGSNKKKAGTKKARLAKEKAARKQSAIQSTATSDATSNATSNATPAPNQSQQDVDAYMASLGYIPAGQVNNVAAATTTATSSYTSDAALSAMLHSHMHGTNATVPSQTANDAVTSSFASSAPSTSPILNGYQQVQPISATAMQTSSASASAINNAEQDITAFAGAQFMNGTDLIDNSNMIDENALNQPQGWSWAVDLQDPTFADMDFSTTGFSDVALTGVDFNTAFSSEQSAPTTVDPTLLAIDSAGQTEVANDVKDIFDYEKFVADYSAAN